MKEITKKEQKKLMKAHKFLKENRRIISALVQECIDKHGSAVIEITSDGTYSVTPPKPN